MDKAKAMKKADEETKALLAKPMTLGEALKLAKAQKAKDMAERAERGEVEELPIDNGGSMFNAIAGSL